MMHISQIIMLADKASEDPRCNKMDDFCLVFAEMIIKECAEKVSNFIREDEYDEYECHSASEVIKRHFGVE